ncbi:MAG: hypothetical protein ABR500_12100 [Dermatophilaceae bacterium]|nr:hypothetical protein [Intrasporangiaceae bacterium]
MRRSLIAGLVLAAIAAVVTALGGVLGFDLQHVALLGGAIGGALGLVPHRYSWGRITGFLVGFVIAWIGYALRAAVLPDSSNGRAVAVFLVIALCALACGLSMDRLPLWSALLGVAAIVGAYEAIYTSAPSQFISESPEAATTVLLAVALGYLATSVVHDWLADRAGTTDGEGDRARHSRSDSPPETSNDDELSSLDDLMAGDKK